ncbi:AAA family ATPase [Paraburkholderia madseniana]|uniref:AAA family ATPase n=1 Tax=Paraburkholderia madseniana TaxID=2599607 RepID=UPI0038BC3F35
MTSYRIPGHVHQSTLDLSPKARLWILRLLVPLGCQNAFVQRGGFMDDKLAEALGLGALIDPDGENFDVSTARTKLRKLHRAAEARRDDVVLSPGATDNILRLAQLAGLSAIDCKILEFVVALRNERLLDDMADQLGSLSSGKVYYVLSVLLDAPEADIRAALGTHGVLACSGLVSVDRSRARLLGAKLQLLSDSFADHIVSSDADPMDLLRDTVAVSSPATLELGDYPHVEKSLSLLVPYLRRTLSSGAKGVNVLMHGAPGTGKTELARVLAAEMNCELFEVASEDGDGDPINGERRLRAFRAAQSFLAQRRTMILFDEVEDVFNDGDRGRKTSAQGRKAWINRVLEGNTVPTLWISNSVDCIDPAFVRRFDMVLELPVPPRAQRAKIIAGASEGLLDASAVNLLAAAEGLAPAVVTRATGVVQSIRDELDPGEVAPAIKHLIDSTLEAQGHRPTPASNPDGLPETYNPDFIHTDVDLTNVADGLVRTRAGRLCLCGPPGTGKTAFGRWLAGNLGMPLHVKRASDLMSMYVGGSEKNIARAFRQAERDGALLLIDEIDSFLQDRRGAVRSWEVTQVNEMLTQMEMFPGVFVASTNLMDGLDQAALRRFDLKIRFDYLLPCRAWELLCRHCEVLGLGAPDTPIRTHLTRLHSLTPGDFALVARQHTFRRLTGPADFVDALEAECELKEGAPRVVGFL